jgi:hypothetical protein
MAKQKRDTTALMEHMAESTEAMRSFSVNKPANIDMSRPEDREFVKVLSFHVAAGFLYEAEPDVFKFTPGGIEHLKQMAKSSRETRLEAERMSRN